MGEYISTVANPFYLGSVVGNFYRASGKDIGTGEGGTFDMPLQYQDLNPSFGSIGIMEWIRNRVAASLGVAVIYLAIAQLRGAG